MLSCYTEKHRDITIIHLQGVITDETVKQFEINTYSQIEQNITTLVLDFKAVELIDSTGISHLLKLSRKAILDEVELILCDLNDSIKKLFETAQMDKFFNILSRTALQEKYF